MLLYENFANHSYENNKFKTSALTWNEEFELPDGSFLNQIFKITSIYLLKTWRKD